MLLFSPSIFGQEVHFELKECNKLSNFGLVHILYLSERSLQFEPIRIFIDDKKVCNLNPSKYSSHYVIPGLREFKGYSSPAWFRKQEQGQYFVINKGETHYLLVGYVSNSYLADIGVLTVSLISMSQGQPMFLASAGGRMSFLEEPERSNALLYIEKFNLMPDKKCLNKKPD
jgi:hypothetical protein